MRVKYDVRTSSQTRIHHVFFCFQSKIKLCEERLRGLSYSNRPTCKVDSWALHLFAVFLFADALGHGSNSSTQGWVIGTMCAVALLTLIALMACYVRKNKGGKYAGTPPPTQRHVTFSMDKGQLVFDQGWVTLSSRFRKWTKIQLMKCTVHVGDISLTWL